MSHRAAGALLVGLALVLPAMPAAAHRQAVPTARQFGGTPRVGALFLPGLYPAFHTCTASVVHSSGHDVVMTAAHCMQGSGVGYVFAPGYHDGKTPYGTWRVTEAYGSGRWVRNQDPQRDFAFLVVARRTQGGRSVAVEDVTGGNRLGKAPKHGRRVTVTGYVVGNGGDPVNCRTRAYRHAGYPAFNCGGFKGGTSGSPWLAGPAARRSIVGVIGGLHQGGCSPATSYSSRLGRAAHAVLHRAEHHGAATTFPVAGSDGC